MANVASLFMLRWTETVIRVYNALSYYARLSQNSPLVDQDLQNCHILSFRFVLSFVCMYVYVYELQKIIQTKKVCGLQSPIIYFDGNLYDCLTIIHQKQYFGFSLLV